MAAQLEPGTVPQHATFTRSKDDILNALSFYFGQPVSPEKLKDYNEHHAATCACARRHTHTHMRSKTPHRLKL
jgi:hypothetical protein